MSIEVTISGSWDAWIEGFGQMGTQASREISREMKAVGDVMFDRSQQYVHVISGDLKGSCDGPKIEASRDRVEMTLDYAAEYAIYEHARGGDHAFLDRAYEATSDLFEQIIPKALEKVVARWR